MNLYLSLVIAIASLMMASSQPVSQPVAAPTEYWTGTRGLFKITVMRICLMQSGCISADICSVCISQRSILSVFSGGWSILDPKDAEAKKAAKYAVSVTYPAAKTSMKVVAARVQVVNGYNYDMNVAVTFIANRSCSMQNYVVWKSGDPRLTSPYSLTSKKALTSQKCRSK